MFNNVSHMKGILVIVMTLPHLSSYIMFMHRILKKNYVEAKYVAIPIFGHSYFHGRQVPKSS